MFSHILSENTELRLLEERHAEELSDLTDRNRDHLRAWLPWVDRSRTVEDRENFVKGALKQGEELRHTSKVGISKRRRAASGRVALRPLRRSRGLRRARERVAEAFLAFHFSREPTPEQLGRSPKPSS